MNILLVKNFEEAKVLFSKPDIYLQKPEMANFRKELILSFDFPIKKQSLAPLPDILIPHNSSIPSILENFEMFDFLLERNHDINELSSRGTLLQVFKELKPEHHSEQENLKMWRKKIITLGGVAFKI